MIITMMYFVVKTVLLPCDDPEWSNFTKFFAQNFEKLGLKKLISTSYAIESKKIKDWEPTLFETESPYYAQTRVVPMERSLFLTMISMVTDASTSMTFIGLTLKVTVISVVMRLNPYETKPTS